MEVAVVYELERREIETLAKGGVEWLVTYGPLSFVLHNATNMGGTSLSVENVVQACCIQSGAFQFCGNGHGPWQRLWLDPTDPDPTPTLARWLKEHGEAEAGRAAEDLLAQLRRLAWTRSVS